MMMMMRLMVIIGVLALCIPTSTGAQLDDDREWTSVLECTGMTADNWTSSVEIPVSPAQGAVSRYIKKRSDFVEAWLALEGQNVWEGYPPHGESYTIADLHTKYGYDWPYSRTFGIAEFKFYTELGDRWVQLYYSAFTPQWFYVLPFVSMEMFADEAGDWYGIHPCGAFRVHYEDMAVILALSGLTQ